MLIHNLVATGSLSYNGVNISYVTGSQTSLDGLNQFSASVNTTTGSLNSTTGSLNTATGSLFTASGSFSTRVTRIEGNYATTGSNVFLGAQTVCANITSTGTIIAQTLNVQQVTSSIVYSSGSNIFGCSTSDVQQITGSLRMTGSIATFSTNCFGIGTSTPLAYNNYVALTVGDNSTTKTGLIKIRSCYNAGDGAEVYQTTAGTFTIATNGSDSAFRIFSNNIASFTCQTCAPGMDIMPSGIGVNTLSGIMRVVTTGTSTGIAVGQSNSNRYTHFAANDIQVFNDDFFLTTRCAFPLSIGTCYTARLTFAATGVACFSCQVCMPVLLASGCVGIGCTSPGFTLDVNGTLNVCTSTGSQVRILNYGGSSSKIRNTQGALVLESTGDTAFETNGVNEKMRITSGGNVGINTSSPDTLLHIRNCINGGTNNYLLTLQNTCTVSDARAGIAFLDNSNTAGSGGVSGAAIQVSNNGVDGAGNLIFSTLITGTNCERMRITSGGNVGIGGTSPCAKLHIQGCSGAQDLLYFCDGGTTNTKFVYNIQSGVDDAFILRRNHTTQGNLCIMSWTYNGYVGVRTMTPSYALQVEGPSNSVAGYFKAGGTSGYAAVAFSGDGGTNVGVLTTTGTCIYLGRSNGTIGNQFGANDDILINCTNGNVKITQSLTVGGALSKGSGSFRIKHPLLSKKCTHQLVHSFIEGPNADLIYSGRTILTSGIACINIDCAARMTQGTFEALNRCVRVFTTNESSWDQVRGKVIGNILIIESQNSESTDDISWMVIGERQDEHMFETEWTDNEGRVITEPEVKE